MKNMNGWEIRYVGHESKYQYVAVKGCKRISFYSLQAAQQFCRRKA